MTKTSSWHRTSHFSSGCLRVPSPASSDPSAKNSAPFPCPSSSLFPGRAESFFFTYFWPSSKVFCETYMRRRYIRPNLSLESSPLPPSLQRFFDDGPFRAANIGPPHNFLLFPLFLFPSKTPAWSFEAFPRNALATPYVKGIFPHSGLHYPFPFPLMRVHAGLMIEP